MARIKLQEIPTEVTVGKFWGQRSYLVIDFTKKTMPLCLGWISYNGYNWQGYRIRTQEYLQYCGWTKPYLCEDKQMKKLKADFSKVYRGGVVGY